MNNKTETESQMRHRHNLEIAKQSKEMKEKLKKIKDKDEKKKLRKEYDELASKTKQKHLEELKIFQTNENEPQGELQEPQKEEMKEKKENLKKDLHLTEQKNDNIQTIGGGKQQEQPQIEKKSTPNTSNKKKSKAQKRREKKNEEERKYDEELKELENLPKTSERDQEEEKIKEKLLEKKMKMVEIASDGNCLYNAISHQLDHFKAGKLGNQELRNMVAHHLMQHKNDYISFLEVSSESEFNEYCDKIKTTSQWAGHVELQILSKLLKRKIFVFSIDGDVMVGEDLEDVLSPHFNLSFHKFYCSFGEHYNSIIPI